MLSRNKPGFGSGRNAFALDMWDVFFFLFCGQSFELSQSFELRLTHSHESSSQGSTVIIAPYTKKNHILNGSD